MFGLDVTLQEALTADDLDELGSCGTKAGAFVRACLQCYMKGVRRYGLTGASMHDACPVMYLIHPELFEGELAGVAVEQRIGHRRENRDRPVQRQAVPLQKRNRDAEARRGPLHLHPERKDPVPRLTLRLQLQHILPQFLFISQDHFRRAAGHHIVKPVSA